MKKYTLLSLAVVLVVLLLLPTRSAYYGAFMYCDSVGMCRHEIGHWMDDELGYPSRSTEWGTVTAAYLYTQIKYLDGMDEISNAIIGTGGIFYYRDFPLGERLFGCPQGELYANIYAIAGGDTSALPVEFQKFYSPEPKYTDLYDCLMSAPLKLCGGALHKEKQDD